MPSSRDQARPAPATVTRFSEGELEPPRRTRRARTTRSGRVQVNRIAPAVMARALELADHDAARLVIDPTTGSVTVVNRSKGRA